MSDAWIALVAFLWNAIGSIYTAFATTTLMFFLGILFKFSYRNQNG